MLNHLVLLAFMAVTAGANQGQPVLELTKKTYALGENVFFWVGVTFEKPLGRESYEPCLITITNPDGVESVSPLSLPVDGDPRFGWRGGHGLSADETIPGEYKVRIACGTAAQEGTFEVVALEELREVDARFEFAPGCQGNAGDHTISLQVRNRSKLDLLLATPGGLMGNFVGFAAETSDPPSSCHAFFPPAAMGVKEPGPGDVLHDSISYDALETTQHVRLSPGDAREWSFCLSRGVSGCPYPDRPMRLEVFTQLHLLLGTPGSRSGRLGPLRLPVSASFDVSRARR